MSASLKSEMVHKVTDSFTMTFRFLGDAASLVSISVEKEFRRQGLGSRLLRRFEFLAARNGCMYVELSTGTSNFDWYLNRGYTIVDMEGPYLAVFRKPLFQPLRQAA